QFDVLELPETLSYEAATLIEPLGCCLRGIERACIKAGDTVLILGAGSNGQVLAMLAPQRGAIRVIVSDPIAYRRQRALEAGADAALDPLEAPLLDQIYALNSGHKPDVVIVTPSSINVMQQGVNLVEAGGTVLFFAPPPPSEVLPVVPN